jgi:hypothetical protein
LKRKTALLRFPLPSVLQRLEGNDLFPGPGTWESLKAKRKLVRRGQKEKDPFPLSLLESPQGLEARPSNIWCIIISYSNSSPEFQANNK